MDSAWRSLDSLYGYLRDLPETTSILNKFSAGYAALCDDLNTPLAISELHRLAKKMHSAEGEVQVKLKAELLGLGLAMGLLQQDPEAWFTVARSSDAITEAEIKVLIEERRKAKIDKDYLGADAIRQSLLSSGVVLEDSREGTKWRRD